MLALLKPLLGPMLAGFATLIAAVVVVWFFAGQLDRIFQIDFFLKYRLMIVIGLIVIWLLVLLVQKVLALSRAAKIEKNMRDQAQRQIASAKPSDRQAMAEVEGQLKEAIAALKTSKLGKSALYTLPWYVIIGPPGSGKTTALQESGLKFPYMSQGRRGVRGVGGTRNCDWWFTDDGILLDTAGRYTSQLEDRSEWQGFLDLVKKTRPKTPINGAIVAIGMDEILNGTDAQLEAHAENIRGRLDELRKTLEEVFPVYVLFTKADLLSGFVEIFEDLGRDQRSQVWGFTLPFQRLDTESYVKTFLDETKSLYDRLAEHRLSALSVDRHPAKKQKIYAFPQQFALARKRIGDFIRELCHTTQYEESPLFRGFYLTSGTQEGAPIDQVLRGLEGAFGIKTKAKAEEARGEKKSYFLGDLFTKVVFLDKDLAVSSAGANRRRGILRLGISVASLLFAGYFGFRVWANHSDSANTISEVDLAAQRVEDNRNKGDRFLRLESLSEIDRVVGDLERRGANRGLGIGMFIYDDQDEHLEKARKVRDRELLELLLRPCKQGLREEITRLIAAIKNGNPKQPDDVPPDIKRAYKANTIWDLPARLTGVLENFKIFCDFDERSFRFNREKVDAFLRDEDFRRWMFGLDSERLSRLNIGSSKRDEAYRFLSLLLAREDLLPRWEEWGLKADTIDRELIEQAGVDVRRKPDGFSRSYKDVVSELVPAPSGFVGITDVFRGRHAELLQPRPGALEAERGVPQVLTDDYWPTLRSSLQKEAEGYRSKLHPDDARVFNPLEVVNPLFADHQPLVKEAWVAFALGVVPRAPTDLSGLRLSLQAFGSDTSSPLAYHLTSLWNFQYLDYAPEGPAGSRDREDPEKVLVWLRPCMKSLLELDRALGDLLDPAGNVRVVELATKNELSRFTALKDAITSARAVCNAKLVEVGEGPKRDIAREYFDSLLGNAERFVASACPDAINAYWRQSVRDPLQRDYLGRFPFVSDRSNPLQPSDFAAFFGAGLAFDKVKPTLEALQQASLDGKPLLTAALRVDGSRWSLEDSMKRLRMLQSMFGSGQSKIMFSFRFNQKGATTGAVLRLGTAEYKFPIDGGSRDECSAAVSQITFSISTSGANYAAPRPWTGPWAFLDFLRAGRPSSSVGANEAGYSWFGEMTNGVDVMELRFTPQNPVHLPFFRGDAFEGWSNLPERIAQ